MRVVQTVLGVLIGLAIPVAATAQQVAFEVAADIYLDENANSVWDANEVRVADWPLQLLDDTFTVLGSELSNASDTSSITTDTEPSFVCAAPHADFIQTWPLAGTAHPDDGSWLCWPIGNEDVYVFGVVDDSEEAEEQPEVLGESNVEPIEKITPEVGAVLGETSPEILAETGQESWMSILVGLSLIVTIFALARRPQID